MIMILLQTVDIKGIHLVPHLLWIFLVEKVLLLVLIKQHLCHFAIICWSGRKCFSHVVLKKQFSYVCCSQSLLRKASTSSCHKHC